MIMAAAEMGIPRYQLTAWVKAQGYESFSRWMTAQPTSSASVPALCELICAMA